LKTLDDYLGAKGLDNTPHADEMTGQTTQPTWEPLDSSDFGNEVVKRINDFRSALEHNGLLQIWRRNYRTFFNGPAHPTSDGAGWGWSDSFAIVGDNGEIMNVRLSEPRTLITRMANLACAKPVALRAIANDSTPEALEAAQIADATLQEDFNPTAGGQLVREGVELALAVCAGFLDAEWDVFAGEAYVPTDDGGVYYSGKPKLTVRFPDEVCFDLTKRKWEDVLDCIVIQRANRYMLASQFPDQHDEIMSVPSLHDSEFKCFRFDDENTDDVVLLRYMHKPGNKSFLPNGRLALVLENGTVLRDGANPYALVDPQRIGIFPITAGNGLGSIYGYATMNDLSPLSQWLNLMATMAATIIAGYGAPNMQGPNMSAVSVQQMVGGGRYFGVPDGQAEIKAINLLDDGTMKTLLEVMKFIMDLGEKHSGTSGLARDPGDGDSGKKTALMQSMAVQFMSSLQQSIVATVESLGNYFIRLRQCFSTADEVAEIGGIGSNAQQIVSYKAAEKFPLVAKVRAEAIDPVTQTPQGREMRADKLLQMGAFKDSPVASHEYMQMLKTGRDEPLFRAPLATVGLILRENQILMAGQDTPVMADDDHEKHVPEHLANLADPNARDAASPVARATLEHVARHKMFAMGVAPMQGVNPQTGQPFPPATVQFQQAMQQRQMQQQQQAAMQQQGPPQGKPAPHQAPPQQAKPGGPPPQPTSQAAGPALQQAATAQA
jgi:hypothetical protein